MAAGVWFFTEVVVLRVGIDIGWSASDDYARTKRIRFRLLRRDAQLFVSSERGEEHLDSPENRPICLEFFFRKENTVY